MREEEGQERREDVEERGGMIKEEGGCKNRMRMRMTRTYRVRDEDGGLKGQEMEDKKNKK